MALCVERVMCACTHELTSDSVCWLAPAVLQNDEFLRLTMNAVRMDLVSRNEAFETLALSFIGSGETAHHLQNSGFLYYIMWQRENHLTAAWVCLGGWGEGQQV